jgi:hypothetical protein
MAAKVKYLKSLDGSQPNEVMLKIAASQTIVSGDLLVITTGKGVKAGAAATAVFGIALKDITTGGSVTDANEIPVLVINEKSVLEISYTGTALTSAGLWITAYDITAAQVLDTADTTGGFLLAVALPNTTKTTQEVIVKRSALFNA